MFHRTGRLLLRPIWPEDWQAIHCCIADEGIVRNLARAPWPYLEEDARKFVQLPVEPNLPRFAITIAHKAQLIGCIGIDQTESGQKESGAELGYWIARPHWGMGYATEAASAVLQIAAMLGHRHIVASHFLDNPASGKVLRKLGFAPTGCVAKRYSLARDQEVAAMEYAIDLDEVELTPPMAA